MEQYTVLGISAGGGVSLYPFRKKLIGNVEPRAIFHTLHEEQWKTNFGKIPFKRDTTSFLLSKPDIVLSSPDCGSGSILRFSRAKKIGNHRENKSLLLFFSSVEYYKPKFFLFENLEGLFKSFPEQEFDELLKEYRLIKHIAPVSAWGNSQIHRKRLVIVGIRRDLGKGLKKYFKLPTSPYIATCKELYGKLGEENPEIGHVREDINSLITIYAGKKMTLKQIQDYWQKELKDKKRWVVTDRKFTTAPGVYRNRLQDYPATARKANRQFDHWGLTLTPRQLAIIQGVPDEFGLYMDMDKKQYWINKARATVTKSPSYEISIWFKRCLKKLYKTHSI